MRSLFENCRTRGLGFGPQRHGYQVPWWGVLTSLPGVVLMRFVLSVRERCASRTLESPSRSENFFRKSLSGKALLVGAAGEIRTPDLLITRDSGPRPGLSCPVTIGQEKSVRQRVLRG